MKFLDIFKKKKNKSKFQYGTINNDDEYKIQARRNKHNEKVELLQWRANQNAHIHDYYVDCNPKLYRDFVELKNLGGLLSLNEHSKKHFKIKGE